MLAAVRDLVSELDRIGDMYDRMIVFDVGIAVRIVRMAPIGARPPCSLVFAWHLLAYGDRQIELRADELGKKPAALR